MNKRILIFIIVFSLINLVFIPLLSLYGLRVCPVLAIPGFIFGCIYSGLYIFFVNVLNLVLIYGIYLNSKKSNHVVTWLTKNRFVVYVGVYLIATAAALLFLQKLLHMNHLSEQSRAPEILGIASLLLGILQAYGLNWALYNVHFDFEMSVLSSFRRLWVFHIGRVMLPLIVAITVILHFLLSQSISFNEGRTAPLGSHDSMIEQSSYVVLFIFIWLAITFFFHFLSESDQVNKVQTHLKHLNHLEFKFRSTLNHTWGLWAALIDQLNSFSKALGERTRLLKSFSRFVTAGVAEQALHKELKVTTGTMRELTVIMSDIRNFTSMSELLTPDQVVLLLNEYFSAMLEVIAESQVSVDKFIGDGILAYVDPNEGEISDPIAENRLGVDTALAMIEKLKELNIKLKLLELPEIKIGIGIYRGPLIIGFIGSEAKLQHTIIGGTVNRAARLESLCKELGVSIVISGHVWHSLDESKKLFFSSFGKQVVKGVSGPLEVFGGPN